MTRLSRAQRSVAGRLAVLASAACCCLLLAAPPAMARAPRVHVIDVGGRHPKAGGRRKSPGTPPLLRLRGAAGARASSTRVDTASDVTLRTNGKILGVDPREGKYSCSGTAIRTPSKSIVLTAGHCAIENGVEGRRIVFVPVYDHGARPFDTFRVTDVYVTDQWRRGENPDFDVAAMKVRPNALGALTDVVGGRGWEVSRSRSSRFTVFGYPAAALKGEELRSCQSHGLGSDRFTFAFLGPPTVPTSCNMAAGASGGGWIADGDYVNGVTSYSYAGRPTRLYSSYFGSEIGAFLRSLP